MCGRRRTRACQTWWWGARGSLYWESSSLSPLLVNVGTLVTHLFVLLVGVSSTLRRLSHVGVYTRTVTYMYMNKRTWTRIDIIHAHI